MSSRAAVPSSVGRPVKGVKKKTPPKSPRELTRAGWGTGLKAGQLSSGMRMERYRGARRLSLLPYLRSPQSKNDGCCSANPVAGGY
jgi:hypothetical protein